jgi:hypothetical protein
MTDRLDVVIVVAEFPSAPQARRAFDDVERWTRKPAHRAVSAARLSTPGDGRT